MKTLTRPDAPAGLEEYNYREHHWGDLSSEYKKEVKERLEVMQGKYCAYCERKVLGNDSNPESREVQHIEHFRRKGLRYFPELTFSWNNLFLSCSQPECCGKYKDDDRRNVDYSLLIKPDEKRAEEDLLFLSSGKVVPRSTDSASESYKKAVETIRVFNLNGKRSNLQGQRFSACQSSLEFKEIIQEALEYGDHELAMEIITQELETLLTHQYPHFTAIKHVILPSEIHSSFF